MSQRRVPSPPPSLAGFTYVEPLGSGGFADVFLYEQQMPKRRVAVKVLLIDRLGSSAASQFTAEANVMAMLSTHPAIVTIYQAGVADDGRPYLVMEYCPRPNLQVRYRSEPFSVAESLRVGVQVAAAVETAHRAGVLHRDIKPANILVTEYNRPALTDFGIASTSTSVDDATGMSIPWSPPESFTDVPQSGPRSDVYALGATIYTLLAGRSPFELPGERNSSVEIMERIERMPLPPLARLDAPQSLIGVLARAMSKSPGERYPSAVAFARALQKVQIELSHSVTPIDIIEDHLVEEVPDDEDDGLTRVRGVVRIDPDAGTTRPSATTQQVLPPSWAAAAPAATSPASIASADEWAPGQSAAFEWAPSPPAGIAGSPGPHALAGTGTGAGTREPGSRSASDRSVADSIADASETVGSTVLRPSAPTEAALAGGSSSEVGAFGSDAFDPGETVRRAPTPAFEPDVSNVPPRSIDPAPARKNRWPLIIAAGVLVVAGVAVAAALPGILSPEAAPTPASTESSEPIEGVVGGLVPPVDALVGAPSPGGVTFTWSNPDPQEGDTYLWGIARVGETPTLAMTGDSTVSVPTEPSGTTCVEVTLRRADSTASEPETACVP